VRDSKNTEFVVWANAQEDNGPLYFAKESASATTYPDILKLFILPQVVELHYQSSSSRMILYVNNL